MKTEKIRDIKDYPVDPSGEITETQQEDMYRRFIADGLKPSDLRGSSNQADYRAYLEKVGATHLLS